MSLRSLLVPVTGQTGDEMVLHAAFSLARNSDAHISVLCIRPDPTDVVQYAVEWSFPIMMDEAVAAAELHSAKVGRKASAMFERWRSSHELPISAAPSIGDGVSVSWQEHVGAPGPVLRDLSRFTDIVVTRSLAGYGSIEGDEILEATLFDSGRPVLIVPSKPVDNFSGTALIAWDGGREALRAVTAALPLLARMGTVRILTIDGDAGTKAKELALYLAWHGVHADVHDAVRGSATIGESVLSEASKIEAGLVVMGGYHHSRTREMLFGGATRDVIFACKIPVLLAH
ncbi:MAG: putative universal stress protein UspA and related nucleotide-binding protein [Rhodospirillales bacterium]|nr:putative universal stress protein UspA and related nucleotide-binding protein [Rhodospirillales bacterium]